LQFICQLSVGLVCISKDLLVPSPFFHDFSPLRKLYIQLQKKNSIHLKSIWTMKVIVQGSKPLVDSQWHGLKLIYKETFRFSGFLVIQKTLISGVLVLRPQKSFLNTLVASLNPEVSSKPQIRWLPVRTLQYQFNIGSARAVWPGDTRTVTV
jgi:hypothetical protein